MKLINIESSFSKREKMRRLNRHEAIQIALQAQTQSRHLIAATSTELNTHVLVH
jgi:hypothetical protein